MSEVEKAVARYNEGHLLRQFVAGDASENSTIRRSGYGELKR